MLFAKMLDVYSMCDVIFLCYRYEERRQSRITTPAFKEGTEETEATAAEDEYASTKEVRMLKRNRKITAAEIADPVGVFLALIHHTES